MHLPGLWGSVQVVSFIVHERTRRVYGSPAELVRLLVFVACTVVYIPPPPFTTLCTLCDPLFAFQFTFAYLAQSAYDAYWVPVVLVLMLRSASIL